VLILADRSNEAVVPVEEAKQLLELKGNVVSARRARGLAEALAGGTSPMALTRRPDL